MAWARCFRFILDFGGTSWPADRVAKRAAQMILGLVQQTVTVQLGPDHLSETRPSTGSGHGPSAT